jgi:hypothetical protein
MSIILIPIVSYEILKFISYYELDDLLPIFNLNANDQHIIKKKIYKQRLTITKYNHHIEYRIEGKLHRENDLPAVELADGTLEWWQNNKLHRENGPAVIRADGSEEWWVNGNQVPSTVFLLIAIL